MDRPANIVWCQGAAIVFTSATLWKGKGDVEKRHQEAKQKPHIQHQRHTREEDEEFLMCDNGFNSLGCAKCGNHHSFCRRCTQIKMHQHALKYKEP